jgi:hypothetical protein
MITITRRSAMRPGEQYCANSHNWLALICLETKLIKSTKERSILKTCLNRWANIVLNLWTICAIGPLWTADGFVRSPCPNGLSSSRSNAHPSRLRRAWLWKPNARWTGQFLTNGIPCRKSGFAFMTSLAQLGANRIRSCETATGKSIRRRK